MADAPRGPPRFHAPFPTGRVPVLGSVPLGLLLPVRRKPGVAVRQHSESGRQLRVPGPCSSFCLVLSVVCFLFPHCILFCSSEHSTEAGVGAARLFFKMTIIRSQRHGNGGGGDRNSWDVDRLRKTTYRVRKQALFTRYYYVLWSGSTVHRPCREGGEGRGSLGGCTQ